MTAGNFELTTVTTVPARPGDKQDIPVVQVRGEIDTTNADGLRQALSDLASGGLVVDLSPVGHFDSAGFAALDRLLSRANIAIVPPGSVVRTAMTLMHMPLHDTIDAARASLQSI
jgi:anti-anti-sigma factor